MISRSPLLGSYVNRNRLFKSAGVFLLLAFTLPVFAKDTPGSSWQEMLERGDKELSLQKFTPAESWFRQALASIKKSAHSTDDLVKCMERVAAVLALEEKTEEAIAIYRHSLSLLEQKYGNNSPKIVPTLFSLGSIYESEGDPTLAMKLYQRALAINEKNYGPFSPVVADNLHYLGRSTQHSGDTAGAEKHYKKSLTILMQQPDLKTSKHLEDLLNDYGDLLRKQDSSDDNLVSDFQNEFLKGHVGVHNPADTVNQPASPPLSAWQKEITAKSTAANNQQLNLEQQVINRAFKEPLSSASLAPAYDTMSSILRQQPANKEEEARYERMIAIDVKALGPNHPTVGDDLYGLVLVYISQQRYAEAEPLLIRVLSIYQSAYGDDSALVKTVQSTLASVCNKLGNQNKAAALYNDALTQGQIAVDPNKLSTAKTLNELGFLYYSQGKLEDACTVYDWALASTEAAAGKNSPLVAACLSDYADVLNKLGRTAQADEMRKRATTITAGQK
ncbi:MAG: tetratricopeptide repeat protein [Candidatus Obscuribacterales bacterium]|nr:tetratricopeptide repeat protein [Candidatus Obscuribacterales bacterium]